MEEHIEALQQENEDLKGELAGANDRIAELVKAISDYTDTIQEAARDLRRV